MALIILYGIYVSLQNTKRPVVIYHTREDLVNTFKGGSTLYFGMYHYWNYIAAYVAVIYAAAGLYTLGVVTFYYCFTIKNKGMNRDVRREIF